MTIKTDYFLYINIFIGAIYLIMMIIGYKKGFLYAAVNLIYTGLSIAIAWLISPVLASSYPIIQLEKIYEEAELLTKLINLNPLINMALYFVIVFLVLKVFYLFLTLILKSLNKIPVIGKFNQILGAFAGIFNATLIVTALSLLLMLPIFKNGKQIKQETAFKYVQSITDKVINIALDNLDGKSLNVYFKDFDVEKARDDFKQFLISLDNEQ